MKRTPLKRRTRLRPSRPQPFPPSVAALLDARDQWCQRCGTPRGLERHHRRGKAAGGAVGRHAQCVCNGLRICGPCHAWVHAHPELAMAEGFIVPQWQDFPGAEGVMRAGADGGVTMRPDCLGGWEAA